MRAALSAAAGVLSALATPPDQEDRSPPVGVSTGIRAARARSQVYLRHRELFGT